MIILFNIVLGLGVIAMASLPFVMIFSSVEDNKDNKDK